MHIPDGFLDTKTIVATATLSLIGVGTAWRQTRLHMPGRRVPLLGLTAAFVFAAQMLNFPVAGGTSGHLMGGVLASVLLGPSSAVIAVAAVLVVQCLLFADGGVLSLGANIFNMAILGPLGGYSLSRLVGRAWKNDTGETVALAVGSWCSVVLASLCCAGELAWSGTVPWQAAFPAMAGVHALIGVGEALLTCLVVASIRKARPDVLRTKDDPAQARGYGSIILYGSAISVGLVLFVSPFASTWPDGLEMVAATLGFDQKALRSPLPSLIPEYRFPGIGSPAAAIAVGGLVGVLAILVVVFALARSLKSKPVPPRDR